MEPKPIKRSQELVPLSRDHHNGLLLCWKIRTGIKNNIDNKRIAAYIRYFFDQDLKEHFRQEEELLFSLLPDDNIMKRDALQQHASLFAMISKIDDKAEIPALQAFADALDAHIRFEERRLFPYIELTIDPAALNKAGNEINACPHSSELEWADAFWIKNK